MRIREKGYRDYGFDEDEENDLKDYCRKAGFPDHKLLLDSAIAANPSIASDLYYTLVTGLSYDKLTKIKYIPLAKQDFYGYQRMCLAIFRNFLLLSGKWE